MTAVVTTRQVSRRDRERNVITTRIKIKREQIAP